jgi:tetratricopeptide (TPR) repeat protein
VRTARGASGRAAAAGAILAMALAFAQALALGAPPADAEVTRAAQTIELMLDGWRFGPARAALVELDREAPAAPETKYLDGYERFLTGDYAGAVRALSAASQAAPANPTVRSLAELAKAARDAIADFQEDRSPQLVIRYATEDAVLVPYARETLQAALAALKADLGFEPELPIRVEFYRSPSDLAAVSSLSVAEVARTGTIALCKWARLMVTTPRALAYGYPWLDSINHELVHYAVSSLSGDRAPVWMQEGLAKFLERRWREPPGGRIPPPMEHLLAKALRSRHLIPFEAMHPSMAKLPSAEDATLAFAEVENAIAYLYEKGGMGALRDAIKRVADGQDARQAVAAAAGGEWPAFERGWKTFMAAQRYKTFPAIDIPTTHIRKAAGDTAKKPSEEDALSSTLKAGAPYRYLRLGDMLLGRDRPRAAAAEYEKGAKAIGKHRGGDPSMSWLFPVKLARTYLELNQPDRALKAITPVTALFPDLPWPTLIAGQARLALGDPAGAVAPLRASLADNPFDPRVHCALAQAYDKLGPARPDAATIDREQKLCKELTPD